MSAEQSELYALKLSGPGITLDQTVSREVALNVLAFVLGGQPSGQRPATGAAFGAERSNKPGKLSIREFLDETNAKRKPDQIAAIAKFICDVEGAASFTRDDVKARFMAAREPLPANFPRDFNWTIKNGWIAAVHGEPENFYVTSKGELAVEQKFSAEVTRATSQKKSRRHRNGARKSEDIDV